jgi:hypothetical protein
MLLVALLVYNPFIALANHGDAGLRMPERHRATVGSSEMQHFSPVQAENAHVDAVIVEVARVTVDSTKYPSREIEDLIAPRQPERQDNLWVRPPPAL